MFGVLTTMDKTKRCAACNGVKSIEEFGSYPKSKDGRYHHCLLCACERVKAYQRSNPEPGRIRARDHQLKKKYGLTFQEYTSLLESQGDACPICRVPFGKKRKHLDHDHLTGKLRGFLCSTCNQAIGVFFDDICVLKSAIEYLKGYENGD